MGSALVELLAGERPCDGAITKKEGPMAGQRLPDAKVLEPFTGTPLITRDGEELGHVKEVRDGSFKVDVPHGTDYWLAAVHILECDERMTRLSLESRQLEPYTMNQPGHALVVVPTRVVSRGGPRSSHQLMRLVDRERAMPLVAVV
jgi:hypothetical protein